MSEAFVTPDDDLSRRLAQIRLAVFDVDGTLTDGRVVYVGGEELQTFCVKDGYALARLHPAGIAHVWITGRGCDATERRAKELGVTELLLEVRNKTEALAEVQARLGVSKDETLVMGDDLPDLEMKAGAGLFAAPRDAAPEVLECADIVSGFAGGGGAAREVCGLLLSAQGAWPGSEG
jgi:3-deoxy-D-manno-octulosonate 8-phosphate phosphatase (KDO 8-P phosphatase)